MTSESSAGSSSPRARAFVSAPPCKVLFLCTHNSARSQIAEAFARAQAPPGTEIWSAGTKPGALHPMAVEVMKEIGIDVASQRAKPIDDTAWREADTVVSLCAEDADACPEVAASVRRVHWPLPDPSSAPDTDRLKAFRITRDELRWRVASLWPRGD
jgi:arsenate reductase (thioredoxin)